MLLEPGNAEERKASFKFPNVAAELLSLPVAKVLDHFAQRREERLPVFDRLLSPLHDAEHARPVVEPNLTRVGYVQKIVMGLIAARPSVFMLYLLRDRALHDSLLANCHSKSMHGLLLLLMLGQSSLQAGAPDGQAAKEADALRADSLAARSAFFETALQACLDSLAQPATLDAHLNICGLLTTLCLRDFPDRPVFLAAFAARFLPLYAEELLRNFGEPGSRAFTVLFTFLETASKEPDAALFPVEETAAFLRAAMELIAALPAGQPRRSLPGSRRGSLTREGAEGERGPAVDEVQTTSYGKELQKTNAKLVRLIDVLRVVFRKHAAGPDRAALAHAGFADALVALLAQCPQNNILHNQVLKFWVAVVELGDETLFDCFLGANARLRRLLGETAERSAENRSNAKNPLRSGYLGHLKTLFEAVLKSGFAPAFERDADCAHFCSAFYLPERQFENYCLGDVDIGQVDLEAETYFAFNPEDFRRKYARFLELEDELTADSEAEGADALAADGAEPEPESSATQRLPSHDLEEEVKNLDVMTVEEEAAFFDSNYWRPIIDYDIEKLSREMGFVAL